MRTAIFRILALFLAVLSINNAFAKPDDEGLYGKIPPENSAFVRFIHAQPGLSETTPKINGKKYDPAIFGAIKNYVVIPSGKTTVSFGNISQTYTTSPKKYYSILIKDQKATFIEEPITSFNKLKAQVVLYNFSKENNISLKTADGKITVVDNVSVNKFGYKEVNAVKVSFAVFAGDKKIGDVPATPLERGEIYTIALIGNGSTPKVVLQKALISPN